MSTAVTISKIQYEILKRRASLYEDMLRFVPELRWGIEEYSGKRIQEFMREDRLDQATIRRLKKLVVR